MSLPVIVIVLGQGLLLLLLLGGVPNSTGLPSVDTRLLSLTERLRRLRGWVRWLRRLEGCGGTLSVKHRRWGWSTRTVVGGAICVLAGRDRRLG